MVYMCVDDILEFAHADIRSCIDTPITLILTAVHAPVIIESACLKQVYNELANLNVDTP